MLSLRSTFKEDLGCTMSELMLGTVLRLPGQLLSSSERDDVPVSTYIRNLSAYIDSFKPVRLRHPDVRKSYIDPALLTCSHVFVRYDGVKTPLQRPYDGPYLVIERGNKHFSLDIRGRLDTVSIDRLKPAYLGINQNIAFQHINEVIDDNSSVSSDPLAPFDETLAESPAAPQDELPAGSFYDRRGRLIRPPKRYLY